MRIGVKYDGGGKDGVSQCASAKMRICEGEEGERTRKWVTEKAPAGMVRIH